MTGACRYCGSRDKHDKRACRMRKLNADPEFRAANAERMRKLNADPEFRAAHAERMRKRNADPEFRAAHAERMRELNADPEFNPLVRLTPAQRADYDILKRAGYPRPEALAAVCGTDGV